MEKPARWILRNVARRPVEIHRPSGVTVVPASGWIEVDELDAHCLALIRSGALSRHAAPPSTPAETRAGSGTKTGGGVDQAEGRKPPTAARRRKAKKKAGSSAPERGEAITERTASDSDPRTGEDE